MTELGRELTAEEIAEVTEIEPEEVESIKRSSVAPVSLEKQVGDEEESESGQFIADERVGRRASGRLRSWRREGSLGCSAGPGGCAG